jgi:TRAP-type C4-dicarboxylate transport system substrate-binding protein
VVISRLSSYTEASILGAFVNFSWKNKNIFLFFLMPILILFGLILVWTVPKVTEDRFHIVLRLSHVFSQKEELAKAMDLVAARIFEKTHGAVEIWTFPHGQIASYKDGVEMVVRGAHFISVEDPSYIGDYMPEFTALVGPMLYRNYDEYISLVHSPLVKDWVAKIYDKGIKVLSLQYIFGFRNIISDKRIESPKDLSGVKIRTPGSQLFIKTINAMGASATPLPWGETFGALQQGMVDGLEGSEFTNLGTKVYETGKKHVAFTNHFLGTCGVYISRKVWEKIPEEYRRIIEEEFIFGADEMVRQLKNDHASVIEELKSHGVSFNHVDREAFEKRTLAVFSSMPGVNQDMYQEIVTELNKIRSL